MIPIDKLYVYTTIIDGVEKITMGKEGVPFIYSSVDDITLITQQMQIWANTIGIKVELKLFVPLTTLDVIQAMPTDTTM